MTLPAMILLTAVAISLLLNAVLWFTLAVRNQRIARLESQNQTQKKELANVRQRQEIAHDAYRLDADELDKRLQQDYRD